MRISCFCGISTIFLQCCFMSETQLLMISWKGASLSNVGVGSGLFFSWEGFLFKVVGSMACIGFDMVSFQKKRTWNGDMPPPPPLWETPAATNMALQEKKHKKAKYTLTEKFAESFAPGQLANRLSDAGLSMNIWCAGNKSPMQ